MAWHGLSLCWTFVFQAIILRNYAMFFFFFTSVACLEIQTYLCISHSSQTVQRALMTKLKRRRHWHITTLCWQASWLVPQLLLRPAHRQSRAAETPIREGRRLEGHDMLESWKRHKGFKPDLQAKAEFQKIFDFWCLHTIKTNESGSC